MAGDDTQAVYLDDMMSGFSVSGSARTRRACHHVLVFI
jgi:hypothetical protein